MNALSLFTKTSRPILSPRADVPWASGAVFNPGAWYEDGRVHMLFRAVPAGYKRIPLRVSDPFEPTEGFDETYISYIGYASSTDGVEFTWRDQPFILPDADFDRCGAEDPRISKIGDLHLITYTALSEPAFGTIDGVRIALASTKDFREVTKYGVVGPPERDKDAVIFPRLIRGKVAMLHRIVPDIQIVFFDDFEQLCSPSEAFWANHLDSLDQSVIMGPQASWETKKIGVGPTPIWTPDGWLIIYHGVDTGHVYRAGLALLDLDDPRRVISRTADPVLEPELEFELSGDVDNVVFPEGACMIDGVLHVYYGAADKVVGHAKAPLAGVLEFLRGQAV